MKINWKDIKETDPGCGGIIYSIFHKENCDLIKLELAIAIFRPFEKSQRHYHKWMEEIYHIIDGNGKMEVGEETFEIGPEDSIAIPVKTPHQIENTTDKKLIFLSINSLPYDPADFHKC